MGDWYRKTATKEESNETIKWIRKEISAMYGNESANKVIIQYGGSIKPENAKELLKCLTLMVVWLVVRA